MLKFLARFTGIWLIAAALIALVVDGAKSIAGSAIITTPLGQLWFEYAADSLQVVQVGIERHMAGWFGGLFEPVAFFLWDPVVVTILQAPAFLVAGVVGIALLVAGRPKRDPLPDYELR